MTPTGSETRPKTEKELKKEAAKAEKLKKYAEKQAKLQQQKLQQGQKAKDGTKAKNKDKKSSKKEVGTYDVEQAPGEKKDVSGDMPNAYSPRYVEAQWYSWWEKCGFFKPEYYGDKAKGQFVMVIPPPNVTGTLHLGHALTNSIEDAIARWHRMMGRSVLWVPGCDHAGIATQVVVEKKIKREMGLTRHDLGREKFVEKVFEWKNEKGDYIYNQLRALGSSVDWERACFTMEPKMCKAVTEAFVRMHDMGLIYRSTRLVHWSCTLKSAISDIEVDKEELPGRTMLYVPGYKEPVEFGVLVHFAYRIDDSEEEVCVATTRIETMLGDTAVAVNPADKRYMHLVGRTITHPFCGHKLRVVADEHADMNVGTGCVKITPAHDHNDYEVGMRHSLEFITVIDDDGLMTDKCGIFAGMPRYKARTEVLKALKERGLYRKTEDNPGMIVPRCSRSKDVIEPMLKPQWYVKCDEMAQRAKEAVDSGQLKLTPDMHIKTWHRWMDGSRDWCISRQLWWGHRIPAYFVNIKNKPRGEPANNEYWVSGRSREEALRRAMDRFKVPESAIELEHDPDVLDTWFSSGLFPFSVFGWPDQTADLAKFYPTTLLETGHDILFFWVARMIFFAQILTNRLPFKEVYLHAMVRDAHGRKMSKSLGNVVDPLHVIHGCTLNELHSTLYTGNLDEREIERAKAGQKADYPQGIPECGTDAMRFGLCAYTSQGRDINLDVLRIQGYRHFCNKLWQAMRFTLMQLGKDFTPITPFIAQRRDSPMDRWIVSRLSLAVEQCNEAFNTYNFPLATTACHSFWLYDFCDVYLEYSKTILSSSTCLHEAERCRQVLYYVVDSALRLISPFMPFLSEELWQRLPHSADREESICVSSYPTCETHPWRDATLDERVALAQEMYKAARSMRSFYNLQPKQRTKTYIECQTPEVASCAQMMQDVIRPLASASELTIYMSQKSSVSGNNSGTIDMSWKKGGICSTAISDRAIVHVALEGFIDVEKEKTRLKALQAQKTEQLSRVQQDIDRPDFETKVPEDVQRVQIEKRDALEAELVHINNAFYGLCAS